MPHTYSAGLVDYFEELVVKHKADDEIAQVYNDLRDVGVSAKEAHSYLHRRFGFPMNFKIPENKDRKLKKHDCLQSKPS